MILKGKDNKEYDLSKMGFYEKLDFLKKHYGIDLAVEHYDDKGKLVEIEIVEPREWFNNTFAMVMKVKR